MFLTYEAEKNILLFREYKEKTGVLSDRTELKIQNSQIAGALKENSPMIFKEQMLLDTFIQAMEDIVNFEIFALLFVPLTVLQKTRGALVLINKRNRRTFSENDLAVSLIVRNKIIFRMEKLYLLRDPNREQAGAKRPEAAVSSNQTKVK